MKMGLFLSTKKIDFNLEKSELVSVEFKPDGNVAFQMRNGEKVIFNEQDKQRFKNDLTGEEVVEYSGLATDGKTDKSWAIAYFRENDTSPKHHHDERTENYFITEGEALIVVDEKEYHLKAGDSITITPGQKHQVNNTGKTQLSIIVECTPAWIYSDHHLEQNLQNNNSL